MTLYSYSGSFNEIFETFYPQDRHTYEDVEDHGNDPSHSHAEDCLGSLPLTVDKHESHIFEVTHWSSEELHKRVCQTIAGQHLNLVLFYRSDTPVQSLKKT